MNLKAKIFNYLETLLENHRPSRHYYWWDIELQLLDICGFPGAETYLLSVKFKKYHEELGQIWAKYQNGGIYLSSTNSFDHLKSCPCCVDLPEFGLNDLQSSTMYEHVISLVQAYISGINKVSSSHIYQDVSCMFNEY